MPLEACVDAMLPGPVWLPRDDGPPGIERDDEDALRRLRDALGADPSDPDAFVRALPFSVDDTTAGSENELQTAVCGPKESVDLPLEILRSNFLKNIRKRATAGDTSRRVLTELDEFLNNNPAQCWENSWVRFPHRRLSRYADAIFERDLLDDKGRPDSPRRLDAGNFVFRQDGEAWLRVPVSYLLKLALAQAVSGDAVEPALRDTAERLMGHFLNDNTSPETLSFYTTPTADGRRAGDALARETLTRYLMCQFLVQFANRTFDLIEHGQQALIYFAPHPPIRQKRLNDLIPDSFYRELFMSPCLSGWDRGAEKHQYMELCHQVLSRSQLNAVAKLREAGIITNNLVVLPNVSNVSLANNGTHISIGSRRLGRVLGAEPPAVRAEHEKCVGDLVIKIVEHFLPLFVGTYSAAPYRMDFWDFHPEKALGFLPHELDFTHLRMIWRRWKGKANLRFFGYAITPFGPLWLDRLVSYVFGLRGDFVADFRLVDYLVSLLSTDSSPALDGRLGNELALKRDLATMGVFDNKMSLYLLFKLRQFADRRFSGFEGRHYIVFASLLGDLAPATDLQALITAAAFQYALRGDVRHRDIPDDPFIESERRQIFFGAALGIPTFYIRKDTPNTLLRRIVGAAERTRPSHRYPGYVRVYNREYCRALVRVLREDAAGLIDALGLGDTVADLEERVTNPEERSATAALTRCILDEVGETSPMRMSGDDFNHAAEQYYRTTLRKAQMGEAFEVLEADARRLDLPGPAGGRAAEFIHSVRRDVIEERADADTLRRLIHLTLAIVRHNIDDAEARNHPRTKGAEHAVMAAAP
jgi:hypothetical protein